MRKFFLLTIVMLMTYTTFAQVGIHDDSGVDDFSTTPVSSQAVLELRSDARAILIPRLTTSAIDALAGEPGMMVYDKDLNCFKGYDNDHWQVLGEDCDAPSNATPPARINEIEYDNVGADNNEFVEVRADLGTDVSNLTLTSYNGSNGAEIATESVINGTKTSDANYDYYIISTISLQNGNPDGVVLMNGTDVVEFLSYGGTFTASNGPASGEASTDIGVTDNNSTNVSPQRSDDGASWFTALPTPGAANMMTPPTPTTINFATSSATVAEGSGTTTLTIEIANPSPGTATTADVVLTSGSAADLGNYTTQAISFAAGSSTSQTVAVTVSEDADAVDEDYVFQLQNVSGGTNATTGTPASFTLTVTDNETPPQAATFTQDFEGGTGANVYTYTSGGTLTTADGPYPNTPNHVSGTTGLSFSGNQEHTHFAPINTSAASSVSLSFRVAAFADDGNIQFDGSEWIIVGLRTSNGGNPENVLLIEGGSTAYDFTSTTSYTSTYNGSFDSVSTANGPYSYITIENLPISTYMEIIMVSRTNDATKKWVIDDVVLTINP